MKKVRYVIGMLGAATPAIGALAPAGPAVAATYTPAHQGAKTVSLQSASTATPDALHCVWLNVVTEHTGTGANKLRGLVGFGNGSHCIYGTKAILSHSQVGLDMRSRIYNGTKQVHQKYVGGTISPIFGTTSFYVANVNVDGTKACEALVYTTNTGKVAYGPVCEPVP